MPALPEIRERCFFSEKTVKKCLTKENRFGILVKLACGKPLKASEANLENDTEERTRKKEEDSEDSKEFSIERC